MSIEHPVEVKLKNSGVPASLMLIGFSTSENMLDRRAVITLGGVEVLKTHDIYLEGDMQRIEREIKNGTLSINYRWDESLIPFVEMTGERNEIIRSLKYSLRHKGYNLRKATSMAPLDEHAICYVVGWNEKEEIHIVRKHFDTLDSTYFVDVSSGKKPSDALFDSLNDARIAGPPCSCAWGKRIRGNPKRFSYKVGYTIPTRTEPSEISESLSRTASALVKILND